MSFCTVDDVVDLTGTVLNDDLLGRQTIERIITAADRKVNRFLRINNLSTSPTPVPDDIKDASILYAAAMVLNRHMIDGTLPQRYQAEGLSEQVDVAAVIKNYEHDALMALQMYANENVEDVSTFRVVGQRGERVGSHNLMETWEEDET